MLTQTSEIQTALSAQNYEQFADALRNSNCSRCGLCHGRTHIVVDRGHSGAKIMVIGEAPGKNEDLQGRAFVGRAGKVFDEAMAGVGLDSNRDMIICNIVKCRPPANRRPKPEEAAACRPFLLKQIELVAPKVVLLLGATALKRIDPARRILSMEQEAGKFFELAQFPGIRFMTLYHPAALLYNSKLKSAMASHAQKLKQYLDQ